MKLKPLFDRVIARPIKEENKTQSGITLGLPKESEVKKAVVLSVGEGIFEEGAFTEMKVKVNDIIFYEEHTIAKFFEQNAELILIKQTDILAVETK